MRLFRLSSLSRKTAANVADAITQRLKKITAKDNNMWENFVGEASLVCAFFTAILGGLAAVAGIAAWYFAYVDSNIKEEKLRTYQIDAGRQIAVANEGADVARKDAAGAIVRAEDARKDAALANEQTAKLELARVELEKQVVELKLKLKPRIITPEQVANFIFLTERIAKPPIKVSTGIGSSTSFAVQIRSMLTAAGFGVHASVNTDSGITHTLTSGLVRPYGETYEWPDVLIVLGDESSQVREFTYEPIEGFGRPVAEDPGDLNRIATGIYASLKQIGLSVEFSPVLTNWAKPGEIALVIPPRGD